MVAADRRHCVACCNSDPPANSGADLKYGKCQGGMLLCPAPLTKDVYNVCGQQVAAAAHDEAECALQPAARKEEILGSAEGGTGADGRTRPTQRTLGVLL